MTWGGGCTLPGFARRPSDAAASDILFQTRALMLRGSFMPNMHFKGLF
jgi:hypothetical protein